MHLFPVKRTLFQYFFPDVFPVKSRHCFNIFSIFSPDEVQNDNFESISRKQSTERSLPCGNAMRFISYL